MGVLIGKMVIATVRGGGLMIMDLVRFRLKRKGNKLKKRKKWCKKKKKKKKKEKKKKKRK